MKARHEQACGGEKLPDVWSLIDQPEAPETVQEPAGEESAEQTPEPRGRARVPTPGWSNRGLRYLRR
jgi:hypothetical protein